MRRRTDLFGLQGLAPAAPAREAAPAAPAPEAAPAIPAYDLDPAPAAPAARTAPPGSTPGAEPGPEGERLQKVLARAGVGSRRVCDELVSAGRVSVNCAVAVVGQRVDPRRDVVAVDGVPVPVAPDLVYYLVNKPAGVVTTVSDPHSRRTVVDLVPRAPRVFPVGRLDYDTEGLIILTNDGELAHRLAHPSYGVAKEYLAEVEGTPGAGALRQLREGVELDDGRTAPAVVGKVAPSALRIVLHEGRNRQVRRMLEAVGHPVRRLVRTRIGPVADTALRPGSWRPLRPDEVRALYAQSVAHDRVPPSARDGGDRASRRRDGAAAPRLAAPRVAASRTPAPRAAAPRAAAPRARAAAAASPGGGAPAPRRPADEPEHSEHEHPEPERSEHEEKRSAR